MIFCFVFYSKATNSEILVRCSSLLVGVLGCYCFVGIIPEEQVYTSELFQKAKVGEKCADNVNIFSGVYSWENQCICLENTNFYVG